jgi:hypothetical protein
MIVNSSCPLIVERKWKKGLAPAAIAAAGSQRLHQNL